MQATIHEFWARFLASSMKDDLRYTPSDCFETFPFPAALLESNANDPAHEATRQSLEAIGERYHQFRAELMITNNEGLTSTYNRFHDPAEASPGLLELRRLHGEMNQEVLNAYGWSDVHTACSKSCPAGAIVFGDVNDPESAISKYYNDERTYFALEELKVLPSVAYKVKVRNKVKEETAKA
jgi:hypothetical protein